jgi:hypothetical protein
LVKDCSKGRLHFHVVTVALLSLLELFLFEVLAAIFGPTFFHRSNCCEEELGVELTSLSEDVDRHKAIRQLNGSQFLSCSVQGCQKLR